MVMWEKETKKQKEKRNGAKGLGIGIVKRMRQEMSVEKIMLKGRRKKEKLNGKEGNM